MAAVVWVGGTVFLVIVLVPAIHRPQFDGIGARGFLWISLAQFFSAGPRYDAMLHTIFLGFVFSMIFAHAPIILPTITGLSIPFKKFSISMQVCCTCRCCCESRVILDSRFHCSNGAVSLTPWRFCCF